MLESLYKQEKLLRLKITGRFYSKPVQTTTHLFPYRYKWHLNVEPRQRKRNLSGFPKPGIRSLEPRLQRKLMKICSNYYSQRIAAGLPPYTYNNVKPNTDKERRL